MYRVEFTRKAERDLEALPRQVQKRLAATIDSLSDNPKPQGVAKLSSEEDLYRLRVGNYRLIYAIRDEIPLVLVVRVGHRRDVHRSLD